MKTVQDRTWVSITQ